MFINRNIMIFAPNYFNLILNVNTLITLNLELNESVTIVSYSIYFPYSLFRSI